MAILCGYIRVSGETQRENQSLPAQRQSIVNWCKDKGHVLFNIFEDVASAEDASERESFQFALNTIKSGLADGLVVHKLDRFCRKLLDAELIRKEFAAGGKLLFSVVDPVDLESDDGQLMFQVKNVLQEYERKKIAERCNEGRSRKRAEGGYIGGRPPYGYDAIRKHLVPNQKEQAIIKEIFKMRNEGCTITVIAHTLNKQLIPTKHGRVWGQQQVYRILSDFPHIAFQLGVAPSFLLHMKDEKSA